MSDAELAGKFESVRTKSEQKASDLQLDINKEQRTFCCCSVLDRHLTDLH
jgi:hypothetical protein